MKIVYLSMGSNLGDRVGYLNQAIALLEASDFIEVKKVSAFYETDPVGYEDQGKFINNALEIQTTLSPHDLLVFCLEIEQKLGRQRSMKWGPRTIDIDLLLYEGVTMSGESLTLPHPRMLEREFVMRPLREINSVFEGVG